MKRLICIALVTITTMLVFTSCTDEDITPITVMNGGGSGMEDLK